MTVGADPLTENQRVCQMRMAPKPGVSFIMSLRHAFMTCTNAAE